MMRMRWGKGKRLLGGLLAMVLVMTNGVPAFTYAYGEAPDDPPELVVAGEIQSFAPLEASIAAQVVPYGTTFDKLTLPETVEASVKVEKEEEGQTIETVIDAVIAVEWSCDPAYDGESPVTHAITPELKGEFTFSLNIGEDIPLPVISVEVQPQENLQTAGEIQSFAALSDEAAEQFVSPGTAMEALILPDTLNAQVRISSQEGGEDTVETRNVSVAWSASPAYNPDAMGIYTFTATVTGEETFALDVSAPSITVVVFEQIDIMPSASYTYFKKLELREGAAAGETVYNLLTETFSAGYTELNVNAEYYIYAELSYDAASPGYDTVEIRVGADDLGAYNGIIFTNPIGTSAALSGEDNVSFEHDFIAKRLIYQSYDDPKYGTNSNMTPLIGTYALDDGILTYALKDSTQITETTITFSAGIKLDDAVYYGTSTTVLSEAIRVSVGNYNGANKELTVVEEVKPDLTFGAKNAVWQFFNPYNVNTELDDHSGSVTLYYITNQNSSKMSTYLYDMVEIELAYPAGSKLQTGYIGFSSSNLSQLYHTSYGTMQVETDETKTETITFYDGHVGQYHIAKVTITGGYKAAGNTASISFRLYFPDDGTFDVGTEYYSYAKSIKMTLGSQTIEMPVRTAATSSRRAVVTVNAPGDKMELYSKSASHSYAYAYNQTIDTGTDYGYSTLLGGNILKNGSTKATPYDKTYEASFNTTGAKARIDLVTIPCTNQPATIEWRGLDANGNVLSGTYTTVSGNYYNNSSKGFYMLRAQDLTGALGEDVVAITYVKADIGQIAGSYDNGTTWNTPMRFEYNTSGAYGYFTTAEEGIVIKCDYALYNTDPSLRNEENGNLSVSTEVTSVADNKVNMITESQRIRLDNGAWQSMGNDATQTVMAGQKATFSGIISPYYSTNSFFTLGNNSVKIERGNSSMLVDPVVYLILPAGMSFSEEDLVLKLYKFNYKNSQVTADTVSLAIGAEVTIENVSRLNKTGDGSGLYKITFPKGTKLGYYDPDGNYWKLYFEIPLIPSKSLSTTSYFFNDMIQITTEVGINTVLTSGQTQSGSSNKSIEDTYGLNGNQPISGIDIGSSNRAISLQQLTEVSASSAVKISKIGDADVMGDTWYSYDKSNANSVAVLGATSEGQLRVELKNTSLTYSENFVLVLPIPDDGQDLGTAFFDPAEVTAITEQEFAMSLTYDSIDESTMDMGNRLENFNVAYVTLNGSYSSGTDGDWSYTEITDSAAYNTANAIVITADKIPGSYLSYLYFDFSIENGTPGATNIWRAALSYLSGGENKKSSDAGYVATAIAASSISGYVYFDADANGVKASGETGIEAVTVTAKDDYGRVIDTMTDADGYYEFLSVRDSGIQMTFELDSATDQRFNVAAYTGDPTGLEVSHVTPGGDGLSAGYAFTANQSDYTVNAAASIYYTLSYDGNGGTTATNSLTSMTKDCVLNEMPAVSAKPDDLTLKGYEFVGWNTNQGGTGDWYYAGDTLPMMTGDLTLYAQWQVGTYTVTFRYQGATSGITETFRQVQHGTTYGTVDGQTVPLPAPGKTGYDFVGWATTGTATVSNVSAGTAFNTGSNTTLYAVWKAKEGYTVNYDFNGGEDESSNGSATRTNVAWDADVTSLVTTPKKVGHTFGGWLYGVKTATTGAAYGSLAAEDTLMSIDLKAVWQVKTGYTVNYEWDPGATYAGAAQVTDLSWTDSVIPVTSPTMSGYSFKGWKISGESDSTVTTIAYYGDLAADEEQSSELTLVAVFEAINIGDKLVHFDLNGAGGTWTDTVIPSADTGSTSIIPTNEPARTGYAFAGWYLHGGDPQPDIYTSVDSLTFDDACTAIGSNGAEAVTLIAQWTKLSYTVVFALPSGGGTYSAPGSFDVDAPLPDYDNEAIDSTSRLGYAFGGWYTGTYAVTPGSTTIAQVLTQAGAGVDHATRTITLTGSWSERSYTITYSGLSEVGSKAYTQTGLQPNGTPTNLGYDLTGWTYGGTSITDATTVKSLIEGDGTEPAGYTLALAPVWTVKTGYSVLYSTGVSVTVPQRDNLTWETADLLPLDDSALKAAGVRPGYTFTGWAYSGSTVTAAQAYKDLAGQNDAAKSLTLTGQWTPKEVYTVQFVSSMDGSEYASLTLTGQSFLKTNLLPNVAPKLDGHTVAGYYFDYGGGGERQVTNDLSIGNLIPDDDTTVLTITVVWDALDYEVVYDVNVTDGSVGAISNGAFTWPSAASVLPTAPTRKGYTLEGWYYKGAKVASGTTYAQLVGGDATVDSATLTAQWTAKEYTIKFDLQDDNDTVYTSQTTINFSDALPTYTGDLKKTGYTFKEWSHGTQVFTDPTAKTVADLVPDDDGGLTITVTATWNPKTYIITYNYNGATSDASAGSQTVIYDGTYGALPSPKKTGYDFAGWYEEATLATLFAVTTSDKVDITDDMTIYAKWTPQERTVSFDYRGATGGDGLTQKMATYDAPYGTLPAPTRDGHFFAGWYTGIDGGGTQVTESTVFQSTDALTLYANWTARSYNVAYDAAGGTGSYPSVSGVGWNAAGLLPSDVPVLDGYRFIGWFYEGRQLTDDLMTFGGLAGEDLDSLSDTITVKALFVEENATTGQVTAEMTDEGDAPLVNVTVKITIGGTDGEVVRAGETGAQGQISFDDVPVGIYTLVIIREVDDGAGGKAKQTITKIIEVEGTAPTVKVIAPDGDKNTFVEVISSLGGTFGAAADGLEALFKAANLDITGGSGNFGVTQADLDAVEQDAASLKITLTVEEKDPEDTGDAAFALDIEKIKTAAGASGKTIILPYDLSLAKHLISGTQDTVTTIDEVSSLIRVVIPVEGLSTMKKIQVYRVHANIAEALSEAANAMGEYYQLDTAGGNLILFVKKFSTYALLHTEGSNQVTPPATDGGGAATKYAITFETNGGAPMDSVSFAKGEIVTLNMVPEREGYVFKGWYLDEGLTEAASELTMSENRTVYAAWEAKPDEGDTVKVPLLNTEDHFAYMQGTDKGVFNPEYDMTRAEAAQMFFNLLLEKDVSGNASFDDVPQGAWYTEAVLALTNLGIISGYTDGTFRPAAPITRGEFAAMAVRFSDYQAGSSAADRFTDVPSDHWAYGYIGSAYTYGWLQGVDADKTVFAPDQNITRAEVATTANRMTGRSNDERDLEAQEDIVRFPDVEEGRWYFYPVVEATNSHDYQRDEAGAEHWIASKA